MFSGINSRAPSTEDAQASARVSAWDTQTLKSSQEALSLFDNAGRTIYSRCISCVCIDRLGYCYSRGYHCNHHDASHEASAVLWHSVSASAAHSRSTGIQLHGTRSSDTTHLLYDGCVCVCVCVCGGVVAGMDERQSTVILARVLRLCRPASVPVCPSHSDLSRIRSLHLD